MNITQVEINKITPYGKNTKKHDTKQIENVATSIKKYGFVQPLVLDRNGVIIIGHCRYEAAKRLGMTDVPCVCADELTDEQVRALRIIDNKTNESAWDYDLLEDELESVDLSDFDLSFKFPSKKSGGNDEYSFSVNNILNLEYGQYDGNGDYDIPLLYPEQIPDIESIDLMSFNYCLSSKKSDCGIHFFLHDYQFERVWNDPRRYADMLTKYKFVLTPDFSPYSDMPRATKIFNVYRNRWCGRFWQDCGIKVIPTVTWSDEDSLNYCFDGIPEHSTIAISTMGDGIGHNNLLLGWQTMVDKLHPRTVLLYGDDVRSAVSLPDGEIIYKKITSYIAR